MRDAGPQADDGAPAAAGATAARGGANDEPGLLAASLTVLRLMGGWACSALGLLNLSMGVDTGSGTTDVPYLLFHVVLLAAGLLLLAPRRTRRLPGRFGRLCAGLVAGLGLVVSTVLSLPATCCLSTYAARHGFPFTIVARDGDRWRGDLHAAVADVWFWGCVGLIVLVAAALVRPARPVAPREPAGAHPTHAEHRATPSEDRTADDENVGGLP